MTDYLYDLPNATNGLDSIVAQTITAVPSFTPLVLLFIFFVVALGGITRQITRTGSADYPMWITIASLSTFFVSLLLSVGSGFTSLTYLVITLVLTIFSGFWLFLDKRTGEI